MKTNYILLVFLGVLFFGPRFSVAQDETEEKVIEEETYTSNQTCFNCHGDKTYYYYNDWVSWGLATRLDGVALLHTAMAFVLLLFLVVHIYLTTTGGSLVSYTLAMITGWEEIEENV